MSTVRGKVRVLLHWWRDDKGKMELECLEQSVESMDPPEKPDQMPTVDLIDEELREVWLWDFDQFKDYLIDLEGDEGYADFKADMSITYSYDSHTGEGDSDGEFDNVQVAYVTAEQSNALCENWPGLEEA